MISKQYSQEDYEQNKWVEGFITQFLPHFSLLPKKDKFDVDWWIAGTNKPQAGIEVEVHRTWKSHNFPYLDCHFLTRKKWMAGFQVPVFQVVCNLIGTNAYYLDSKSIVQHEIRKFQTRISPEDSFFTVPINHVGMGLQNLENYVLERLPRLGNVMQTF